MPRITIDDGPERIHLRALKRHRPEYAGPWEAMRNAVHERSILPVRVREAARYRIAIANGCLMCQAYRDPESVRQQLPEEFYEAVAAYDGGESDELAEPERVTIEFVDRFGLAPQTIDDELFARLRESFTEDEVVDLVFCTARNVGFGRFTHVLGLDDSCELAGVDEPEPHLVG
jgi:alkylhydroperoxidase family enzyme